MGSDESNSNVSLIVRDKVTRECPQTTASEEKGEPKRNRAEVLLVTSRERLTARPDRLSGRGWASYCTLCVYLTPDRPAVG